MSFTLNLRGLASRLFPPSTSSPSSSSVASRSVSLRHIAPCSATQPTAARRCLSTTAPLGAKPGSQSYSSSSSASKAGGKGKKDAKGKGRGRRQDPRDRDPKIINLLQQMSTLSPPRLPPPLRFARNRHLRHWTIHRAWLLFRRRERDARERTWMRQHQSMRAACEALRLTDGPGTRPEGYLYRVAMEKKGVYGLHGVPIEYARAQTDTPAKTPWNHDWKA